MARPDKKPLCQERLKELLYYNSHTGIFIWREKPSRKTNMTDTVGYTNSKDYLIITINGTLHKAHRLAWLYIYGKWPKKQLDHINHISNDNRIKNLREVSCIENSRNCRLSKNNTSGFNGVSWNIEYGFHKNHCNKGVI